MSEPTANELYADIKQNLLDYMDDFFGMAESVLDEVKFSKRTDARPAMLQAVGKIGESYMELGSMLAQVHASVMTDKDVASARFEVISNPGLVLPTMPTEILTTPKLVKEDDNETS